MGVSPIEEMIETVQELKISDTPDLESWSKEQLTGALRNWCDSKRMSDAAELQEQESSSLLPPPEEEAPVDLSLASGKTFIHTLFDCCNILLRIYFFKLDKKRLTGLSSS